MPIYEYTCGKCRQEFEWLVRSEEDVECPHCGSQQLTKQFSVPAAHVNQSSSLPVCGQGMPADVCGQADCASRGCPFQPGTTG